MIRRVLLLAALFSLEACASAPDTALQDRVRALEAENAEMKLKLADEMERADIQNFLTRQEVAAARRETQTVRAKCGAACAPN